VRVDAVNDQCPLAPPREWVELTFNAHFSLEDRQCRAVRESVLNRANVFFRCGGHTYRVWYDVLLGQVIRQPEG
jgi:hypothetical protein